MAKRITFSVAALLLGMQSALAQTRPDSLAMTCAQVKWPREGAGSRSDRNGSVYFRQVRYRQEVLSDIRHHKASMAAHARQGAMLRRLHLHSRGRLPAELKPRE